MLDKNLKDVKRLFVLKDIQGHLLKEQKNVLYFDNKMKAKEVRNNLNGVAGKLVWHVGRGPDHHLYRGRVAAHLT